LCKQTRRCETMNHPLFLANGSQPVSVCSRRLHRASLREAFWPILVAILSNKATIFACSSWLSSLMVKRAFFGGKGSIAKQIFRFSAQK
jgi:hypothetical protein